MNRRSASRIPNPFLLFAVLVGVVSLGMGGVTLAQGDTVTYLEESATLLYEISYDQLATAAEANDCSQQTLENSLLHSALRHMFLYLPFEATYYAGVQELEVRILRIDDEGDPRPVLRLTGTVEGIRATNTRFRSFMNGFASTRAGFCFGINRDTLDLWLNVLLTRGGVIEIDPDIFLSEVTGALPLLASDPVADEIPDAEAAAPEETPAAEEPVAADGVETEDAPAEDAATEDIVAEASPLYLPEGYELTPYLTQLRVLTFAAPAEVLAPDTDYAAVVVTSRGTIVIDLFEEQAPQTVNSFVFLARNHFYDGVVFHRVLEDFMAQTGDPSGTGRGGPGYTFADEFSPDLTHAGRGVVSMVNTGPDSNGSQFFITLTATPWLDGLYSVFGAVTEGDDVLDALLRIDPDQPLAVAGLNDIIDDLAAQGLQLDGVAGQTVEAYLTDILGAPPAPGQRLQVGEFDVLIGTSSQTGQPIVGFWPRADHIESLYIVERSRR